MFYSSEPKALRQFIRDKLGFPHTDVGDGGYQGKGVEFTDAITD